MKFHAGLFPSEFTNHKRAAIRFLKLIILAFVMQLNTVVFAQKDSALFTWPEGRQAAVSLSFDDARESQVIVGTHLLDQYGVKATFYVVPSTMEKQLEAPAGRCRPGLTVPDLDALHSRMLQHEVPCIQEPKEVFGARIAQYLDPDGLPISISEERRKN